MSFSICDKAFSPCIQVDQSSDYGDSREKVKHFTFDYCYDSSGAPQTPGYASQQLVSIHTPLPPTFSNSILQPMITRRFNICKICNIRNLYLSFFYPKIKKEQEQYTVTQVFIKGFRRNEKILRDGFQTQFLLVVGRRGLVSFR